MILYFLYHQLLFLVKMHHLHQLQYNSIADNLVGDVGVLC